MSHYLPLLDFSHIFNELLFGLNTILSFIVPLPVLVLWSPSYLKRLSDCSELFDTDREWPDQASPLFSFPNFPKFGLRSSTNGDYSCTGANIQ